MLGNSDVEPVVSVVDSQGGLSHSGEVVDCSGLVFTEEGIVDVASGSVDGSDALPVVLGNTDVEPVVGIVDSQGGLSHSGEVVDCSGLVFIEEGIADVAGGSVDGSDALPFVLGNSDVEPVVGVVDSQGGLSHSGEVVDCSGLVFTEEGIVDVASGFVDGSDALPVVLGNTDVEPVVGVVDSQGGLSHSGEVVDCSGLVFIEEGIVDVAGGSVDGSDALPVVLGNSDGETVVGVVDSQGGLSHSGEVVDCSGLVFTEEGIVDVASGSVDGSDALPVVLGNSDVEPVVGVVDSQGGLSHSGEVVDCSGLVFTEEGIVDVAGGSVDGSD